MREKICNLISNYLMGTIYNNKQIVDIKVELHEMVDDDGINTYETLRIKVILKGTKNWQEYYL
jgi:hypothetical protein